MRPGKITLILSTCVLCLSPLFAQADYSPIDRARPTVGQGADESSSSAGVNASDSGQFLVFASVASNYVVDDTNGVSDIFVFDRMTGDVERVSVSSNNDEADGASLNPAISADGRYVVFESVATNLIPNDANGASDVFLFDRDTDTVSRVSVTNGGSEANGDSYDAAISDDGVIIAFSSDATNLVAADTNDARDVFTYNTADTAVKRASVSTAGTQLGGNSQFPVLSSDGRYIAYSSDADDVVPNDNNEVRDVFLQDRDNAPMVERVSVSSNNDEADGASDYPALSDDGQTVAFESVATNLVVSDGNDASDVFVRDVSAGETELVSGKSASPVAVRAVLEGDGASYRPSIDSSGRYVAFHSEATNLASSDGNEAGDVFVRDRTDSKTTRVSVGPTGSEITGGSMLASINGNANYLSFISDATDVVENTSTGFHEVYVINLQCLVAAPGVVAVDSDSDGTDDCADSCATDPAKTAEGVCGCGVADDDTDGDGVEDCLDECSADASKTAPGTCGCGVSDVDTNGTGLPDCLDPTSSTVPARPVVRRANKRGFNLLVRIPPQFKKLAYQVTVTQRGRVVATRKKRGRKFLFRLGSRGKIVVRYRVSLPGGGFSKKSRRVKFTL